MDAIMTITHYGQFREHVPQSPMIKAADFFYEQGGHVSSWGRSWEPILDCKTVGEARRKFAAAHNTTLSPIYDDEK